MTTPANNPWDGPAGGGRAHPTPPGWSASSGDWPPPGGGYPPPGGGYPPPPPGGGYPGGGYPPPPPGGGYPGGGYPGGGYPGWTPEGGPTGTLAGWWRRVGATVIDGIIIGIPIGFILGLIGATQGTIEGISAVVFFVYLMLMIGRPSGQTIGNMGVRTRVVDARNPAYSIPPGRAALRALVLLVLQVTVIGWILDILWPLWDRQNQTLHDKAAGSVVVRSE